MSAAFWQREGLKYITPAGKDNPEGWDVWSFLRELAVGSVLEIGCGTGRLCRAFDPGQYVGVDINEDALDIARSRNAGYTFEQYAGQSADTALLYTVLLHVSDEDLPALIEDIHADRVIVAEVMGRKWRRPGNPPVFNREAKEYINAFEAAGFEYAAMHVKPYAHYPGAVITFLVFER